MKQKTKETEKESKLRRSVRNEKKRRNQTNSNKNVM
jgi:hypothetical protein